jgi:hypothetical protein
VILEVADDSWWVMYDRARVPSRLLLVDGRRGRGARCASDESVDGFVSYRFQDFIGKYVAL